jgi:hypothetical protein
VSGDQSIVWNSEVNYNREKMMSYSCHKAVVYRSCDDL